MNIWRKLGLADAASMAALLKEVLALRQENRELHQAQDRQSQQQYDGYMDCTREAVASIEHKISQAEEELRSIQPALETNLRDSRQEILSVENTHKDQVLQQMSIVLENQKLLKEGISSITVTKEKSLAQIVALFNEMRSLENKTSSSLQAQLSELNAAYHVISEGLAFLRKNAMARNGIEEKMIAQLDSGQTEIQKILNKSQGVAEDISFLKEYTESLWEAMKLVWINDLIDDTHL